MENHSLIDRIKSKDGEKELKRIYSEYRNEFLLWATRNHSCTTEEAKDVFQQAMIIFYENIMYDKVKEIKTQVKTYLFSIGKNKLLELIRSKGKNFSVGDDQFITADLVYKDNDEEYEEKLKRVESSMAKLGDPCKTILEQYYYHKKSMQEISDVLDYKNRETVKNLKYKCIQRLKQIFKSDLGALNV